MDCPTLAQVDKPRGLSLHTVKPKLKLGADETEFSVRCGREDCGRPLAHRFSMHGWRDAGRPFRSPYFGVALLNGFARRTVEYWEMTPRTKERLLKGKFPSFAHGYVQNVTGRYAQFQKAPIAHDGPRRALVRCPYCCALNLFDATGLRLVVEDREPGEDPNTLIESPGHSA